MLRNKDEIELFKDEDSSLSSQIGDIDSQPSPALPMEAIILMSKSVSYKHGLAALRQTSRGNNEAVECSDAGALARYANDLEPYAIRTSLAGFADRCIDKYKINLRLMNLTAFCAGPGAGIALGTATYGVPGAYIGGTIGAITAFAAFDDSYLFRHVKYFVSACSMLAVSFSAPILASNYSPAHCAISGLSNLAIMGFFANRNNVEASRGEIKHIRKQLAKPYEYVPVNNLRNH